MIRFMHRATFVLAGVLVASTIHAQDLTIGLSTPITALDPHFHNLSPNHSTGRHVFDTWVRQDESQRLFRLIFQ